MNITNDYFLLYHGFQYEKEQPLKLKSLDENLMCEASALVLMCNRKNFSLFIALDEFKALLKQLCELSITSLNELHALQGTLTHIICTEANKDYIYELHKAFSYLKDENILGQDNYKKLISLFDPHEFNSFQEALPALQEEKEKDFIEQKVEIKKLISDLQNLGDNLSYQDSLVDILEYLDRQKFSIGITGVMNAGKSTLLNALMGKEILGSSVVPETANLSLLTYSKVPYAKVFYWSKSEWEKIVYSAQELESMSIFVQESKDSFKEEFDKYICVQRRIEEIDVKNLSDFTSANSKKSNLIKEIELGVNLDFLLDGVQIVDTPGLDDIVIQREEITKDYLSKCDLMIHLMNVAQAVTQKDIEFIIDALIYQNVGKLLVVLTRVDTVKEKELQEVKDYTKKSIQIQLQANNKSSKLDYILSHIEFIEISSKMALLHKLGKENEALDAGYSLEKTGITKLENYLHETLYGKNSHKSELIINTGYIRLKEILSLEIESLHYELRLLSKNEEELEEELRKMHLKKDENKIKIQRMKEEIKDYKEEMHLFCNSFEAFVHSQLLRTQERLKTRLIDDFKYALEKKKKNGFLKGIDNAIETIIKDAMIDTLRDYRHKFMQKSQAYSNKIEIKYEQYGISLRANKEVSTLELINEHFKGGTSYSSFSVLSSKIKKIFEDASIKMLSSLQVDLDRVLKEAFLILIQEINEKADAITKKLIQEFFIRLEEPLSTYEKSLDKELDILKTKIHSFDNEEAKTQQSLLIHKQIKALNVLSKRCVL